MRTSSMARPHNPNLNFMMHRLLQTSLCALLRCRCAALCKDPMLHKPHSLPISTVCPQLRIRWPAQVSVKMARYESPSEPAGVRYRCGAAALGPGRWLCLVLSVPRQQLATMQEAAGTGASALWACEHRPDQAQQEGWHSRKGGTARMEQACMRAARVTSITRASTHLGPINICTP